MKLSGCTLQTNVDSTDEGHAIAVRSGSGSLVICNTIIWDEFFLEHPAPGGDALLWASARSSSFPAVDAKRNCIQGQASDWQSFSGWNPGVWNAANPPRNILGDPKFDTSDPDGSYRILPDSDCVNHAYRFDDEEVKRQNPPPLPAPPVYDIEHSAPPYLRPYTLDIGVYEAVLPPSDFRRGFANGDGLANIADAVKILGYLFAQKRDVFCLDALDANDNGAVNIADPVYLLGYQFASQPPPPPPFAAPGPDPTGDAIGCECWPSC